MLATCRRVDLYGKEYYHRTRTDRDSRLFSRAYDRRYGTYYYQQQGGKQHGQPIGAKEYYARDQEIISHINLIVLSQYGRLDRQGGEDAKNMSGQKRFTTEDAKRVGEAIGVDFSKYDLEQFRSGMDVELEHGAHDPETNVTNDDELMTGKIAFAHMKEFPDYYERLERMEEEAEEHWKGR